MEFTKDIKIIEKTLLSILIRCEEWDKKLNKYGIEIKIQDFNDKNDIDLFKFILENSSNGIYGVKNLIISIKNNISLRSMLSEKIKNVLKIDTNIRHLTYYAKSLKKHRVKERLLNKIKDFNDNITVENIYDHINELSNNLESLIVDEVVDKDKYEVPNMSNIIIDKMDKDSIDKGVIGLKLNKFNEIQRLLCGLQNGFTLIGGDPNVGKTKFITNLFWDCVKSNPDYTGIYISLDDTRDDILTNLISIESFNKNKTYNLSQTSVKQPYTLDDTNMLKIKYLESLDRVRQLGESKRYFIYDIETIDSFDMLMYHLNKIIKKLNKKVFVMIDGVFNLDVTTKTKSDDLRTQGIARANLLKQVADKNHIPLVSTIELGKRKNDGRYKEPTYQDIMETGKFAYNAKLIWLISWNDMVEEMENVIYPKLRFAKNKFTGYKGSLYLEFNRSAGNVDINTTDNARMIYEEKLNSGRKKNAKEF